MVAGGEDRGETFLAEVVSSSRVTIPKPVRHKLKIQEGDEIYVRIWKGEEPATVATKDRFRRK
jgi:AbrB family looped-hinge helix DNA binding protein